MNFTNCTFTLKRLKPNESEVPKVPYNNELTRKIPSM